MGRPNMNHVVASGGLTHGLRTIGSGIDLAAVATRVDGAFKDVAFAAHTGDASRRRMAFASALD